MEEIIILMFIFGIALGVLIYNLYLLYPVGEVDFTRGIDKRYFTEDLISFMCSEKNLINASICLNQFINKMFIYNETPERTEPLDFEEILARGGDCGTYSRLYCRLANGLGFNCTRIKFPIRKEEKIKIFHSFALVYGEEGYCVLDMKRNFCFKFKNG